MRVRRRWIALSAALCLTAGALAVPVATRYYPAYRDALAARDQLQAAQELLRDRGLDAEEADLARAEASLLEAEHGFAAAGDTFEDPLMRLGRRLPLVGSPLEATAALAEAGVEGARLGQDAVAVTRTYLRHRDSGEGSLGEQAVAILEEIAPPMAESRARVERIRAARARIDGLLLPGSVTETLRALDGDLDEIDELVATYRHLSAFLPPFLGFQGPRTYLVLAQNNAELQASGGLISVYGTVTLEEGRIVEQRYADALTLGAAWLQRTGDYVEPPGPLRRYLLKDQSWNLALAGWSPHFPAAAAQAERFYRLAGGAPVDGVIAINVRTIEAFLHVTGPVHVPSYGVTVSAENALDVIEEHTRSASEPQGDRKAFVGLLAEELLSRLARVPPERWTDLVDALETLRDGRQLLFFSRDAALQRPAAGLRLDGALARPDGDYLMLVDASVNSTKLNVALRQELALKVRVHEDGTAHHELRVSYRNDLPAWATGRDPALVGRLMLGGVYGGYARLLAPYRSRLSGVTLAGREVAPEEIASEHGKTVFGRYFALASGEETELAFRYATPATVRRDGDAFVYRLYLQKQSGTGATPLHIDLALPYRARDVAIELDGARVDATAPIETDLSRDRELVASYRIEG